MKKAIASILGVSVLILLVVAAAAPGPKAKAMMKFANGTTQDTVATTGVDSLTYAVDKTWDNGVVQLIVDRIGATAVAGTVTFLGSTDGGKTFAAIPLKGTTTAQSYTIQNAVSQSTFFYTDPHIYDKVRVVITGSGSGSAKYKAVLTVGSGG